MKHINKFIFFSLLTTSILLGLCFASPPVSAAPVNYVVNSDGDQPDANLDGICETATGNSTCTLRAAIQEANAYPGAGLITFDIGNTIADQIINLSSALPDITEQVTIQGPDATGGDIILKGNGIDANGLTVSADADFTSITGLEIANFGRSGIRINGADNVTIIDCVIGETSFMFTQYPGNAVHGIYLNEATGAQIFDNLISGNGTAGSGHGVQIMLGGSHLILGNKIGTDSSGITALPNTASGINIFGSDYNIIGGSTAADRNVISSNQANGISISSGYLGSGGELYEASGNAIYGNHIGTDLSGTTSLPNGNDGITLNQAINTQIGGSVAGQRNLISGNTAAGIRVGSSSAGTTIKGNTIGMNASRTSPLPNLHGILTYGPGSTSIGGVLAGEGNTIAGNLKDGVRIHYASNGKHILGNSIFNNGGLGINLIADAEEEALEYSKVTLNDYGDSDTGGNNLQNFPIITSAEYTGSTSVLVSVRLSSTPSTLFTIHFYGNDECDPSGYGEGQVYLGWTNVMTNSEGSGSFLMSLSTPTKYDCISVTATDNLNNTSEFSSSGRTFNYLPLILK